VAAAVSRRAARLVQRGGARLRSWVALVPRAAAAHGCSPRSRRDNQL